MTRERSKLGNLVMRHDPKRNRKAAPIVKPRYKRGLIRRYSGNNPWHFGLHS